ncbi:unnamed protein product [Clonostachys rosea f. rosea IK726]|uniref:Uncharacterized protein n=1 Tax=Clonostachys rosea f. rosea IK726 TaxID=1349383 RepID=A0ACA9TSU1_BIOOC|nr:unnamed protein product [Clonostachys rosea f. rosea IK726]
MESHPNPPLQTCRLHRESQSPKGGRLSLLVIAVGSCNAQRPACGCCVASGKDCNYYTKPSESRAHALKRKHNELQQKVESDATVLEMLRSSRPEDAQELVERIRQRQDSHSIVQDVQNGALLLQLSGAAPAEIPGSYTAASPSYSTDASESSYYTY